MKKNNQTQRSRPASSIATTDLEVVLGGSRPSSTDEPWGELLYPRGPYDSTGDGGSESTDP